ncbi:MAG TPA: Mur ligase domain-containing protein, partial [Beijerinckia sp.]|nr:Mur ligase domain-containing protein [Beijerinckia sp.]
MRLAELFPQAQLPTPFAEREVRGIGSDSRVIMQDYVFFAVPGTKADGLCFAPQAVERGALAIVAERAPDQSFETAVFIKVDDVRAALSKAAARLYPRQPATIVAITGTSGKTSVAAFT